MSGRGRYTDDDHDDDEGAYAAIDGPTDGSGFSNLKPDRDPDFEDDFPLPPEQVPATGYDDADGLEDDREFKVEPGTYVFAIGPPASGKTTFQSMLVQYLLRGAKQRFSTKQILKEDDPLAGDSRLILRKWNDAFKRREFPLPTDTTRPSVLRFRVKPIEYQVRPINFGLIEVSGEAYKRVISVDQPGARFPRIIEDHLAHPKVNLVFALVCMGHKLNGADDLFFDILTELTQRNQRFARRCSVLFVISNPKAAKRYLAAHEGLPDDALPPGPLNGKEFVRKLLPMSSQLLLDWKYRYKIAKMHIGDIVEHPKGSEKYRIKRHDFRDAEKIFGWMYGVFAGRPFGPTRFQRFLADLIGEEEDNGNSAGHGR